MLPAVPRVKDASPDVFLSMIVESSDSLVSTAATEHALEELVSRVAITRNVRAADVFLMLVTLICLAPLAAHVVKVPVDET